ncbi:MAG: hypothetical protein R3C17_10920 [Planctomycetaceae bacterium]
MRAGCGSAVPSIAESGNNRCPAGFSKSLLDLRHREPGRDGGQSKFREFSVPSLESLSGFLWSPQSVLKHVDAPRRLRPNPEPESNDIVGSAECVAEESNEGAPTPDVPVVEQDNVAANDVVSTESVGWIESLRHEFRSSDELADPALPPRRAERFEIID